MKWRISVLRYSAELKNLYDADFFRTLPDVIYANSRDENKIYAPRLNREDDSLEATSEGSTGEGGGPCHIAFHPKAGLIIANVSLYSLSSSVQISFQTEHILISS